MKVKLLHTEERGGKKTGEYETPSLHLIISFMNHDWDLGANGPERADAVTAAVISSLGILLGFLCEFKFNRSTSAASQLGATFVLPFQLQSRSLVPRIPSERELKD